MIHLHKSHRWRRNVLTYGCYWKWRLPNRSHCCLLPQILKSRHSVKSPTTYPSSHLGQHQKFLSYLGNQKHTILYKKSFVKKHALRLLKALETVKDQLLELWNIPRRLWSRKQCQNKVNHCHKRDGKPNGSVSILVFRWFSRTSRQHSRWFHCITTSSTRFDRRMGLCFGWLE